MLFPVHTRQTPLACRVVAHRGASGYLPEHTLACFELAIRQGADDLELDLVMTSDGHLVVRHENEISATTDVASRPRFADRRTRRYVDGIAVSGWFAEDFTLAELMTLRATERLPATRPASSASDGAHPVATFEQVLDLARHSRTLAGRRVGLVVEIKHPTYFAARGLAPEPRVLAALAEAGYDGPDDPVVIQSFETATLRRLAQQTPVRLGQLVDTVGAPFDLRAAGDHRRYADLTTPAGLAEVSRYADVVGLSKDLVIPRDAVGRLLRPTPIAGRAHDVGLEVYGWTFRRENRFLSRQHRRGDHPDQPGDLAGEIATYLAAGMDSVITDNPDLASSAVRTDTRVSTS